MIQNHLAKAFVSLLKDRLFDDFQRDNPDGQFGGVQDGSTDMPSHIMLSCAANANSLHRSWSIIFLDLEKAFDMLAREIVMPPHQWSTDARSSTLLACCTLDPGCGMVRLKNLS